MFLELKLVDSCASNVIRDDHELTDFVPKPICTKKRNTSTLPNNLNRMMISQRFFVSTGFGEFLVCVDCQNTR